MVGKVWRDWFQTAGRLALRQLLRIGMLACLGASAPAGAAATVPSVDTLTAPPVMQNLSTQPHTVEVDLTAAPATVELLPGKQTRVYAYNGSIPGPTLEVREGDHVIVHFHN